MRYRFLVTAVLALVSLPQAFAQETPNDLVSKVIIALFRDQNTKYLCLSENASLPIIRTAVVAELANMPPGSADSQDTVARVIYTKYPCPFSPFRRELRPATAKDVEGVWLFPETSQRLRFGPGSPMWQKVAALPPKCEAVAY